MQKADMFIIVRIIFLGLLLQTYSSCRQNSMFPEKPNIIFILSDDISYKDFSITGQEMFSTPHIDRLASEGLQFLNAYSGAPECAPARASLMTGRHMGHCRIRANRSVRGQDHLLSADVTVAEVLKEAGYSTAFVGKWGIGLPGTEGSPENQGWDYAYGFYDQLRAHGYYPDYIMENGHRIVLPENHGFNMKRLYEYGSRPVTNLEDVANRYDSQGHLIIDGVQESAKAKNSQDLIHEAALEFIRKQRGHSFFLYYATQLPHGPLITPALGSYNEKDWDLKHKEWAAMITHLDHDIGEMLSLLEETGILENTIIFFAGDNGYSQWGYFGRNAWEDDPLFKNKGPWDKGKFICADGGMRVPFFVYSPKYIIPRKSEHLCSLYDFFETAADLAGMSGKHQTDGISLVPELLNNPLQQQQHEYLYWENGTFNPHAQSVRLQNWFAFRSAPGEGVKLFDIIDDVYCRKDIADQNPVIVRKVENIFLAAHTDSEWYINPGENDAIINAKRARAEQENTMQVPVVANTTFSSR